MWSSVLSLFKSFPVSRLHRALSFFLGTKSFIPEECEYSHTMHPDTIDALFQLLLAAFNDDCPVDEEAVPYSISDIFVAADQLLEAGTSFLGYGQLTYKSECGHEIIGDLIVSDEALKFKLSTLPGQTRGINPHHVSPRLG